MRASAASGTPAARFLRILAEDRRSSESGIQQAIQFADVEHGRGVQGCGVEHRGYPLQCRDDRRLLPVGEL
jgi:hypothetical protein